MFNKGLDYTQCTFNSHASSREKCVEIVKTLHVKFFPFGSVEPVGSVTVNSVYILLKDDQIEFHEIGESRKAEHAFHSDGYKIKGNGLIQTLFLENQIIPEIQIDSSFLLDKIPFLDR